MLFAAATLDEATVGAFVRQLVADAVRRLEGDPLVQRQLSLLDEQAARRGGTVVPIDGLGRNKGGR